MFKNIKNCSDFESVQVCRLCLAEEEDLVQIFNPKGYQGFLIWEIIEELLQMEVSKKDGLPWTICEGCISKVKEFNHFKTTCIKSKISLLTMIANRGLVSSLVPSSPTWPLSERMKAFTKKSISRTCRKDSDEVEVFVKEEILVVSEDEDPLQSVADVRRDEGHGAKWILAPGPPSPPSQEATKVILKRPSSLVNRKDSDEVEVVEILKEESPVTSTLDDPLREITILGKSCLAPRAPSQPSLQPTETILKIASSETSRKDYDEVEVVEIVKEDSPVVSADEDPPWEVTDSRRERESGHRENVNVKKDVDADESLSDAESSSEVMIHWMEGSTCTGASSEDAALSDPLALDKEEDPWELLAGEETNRGDNPVEDYSHVTSVTNVISVPKAMNDMCGVNEEDDSSESLAGDEAQVVENLVENESLLTQVSNVISVSPSEENMVDGCSNVGGSSKICEEIVSELRDGRNKNITKKFERYTSLSALPGEHSLRTVKKFSVKKGQSLKSGDCITSAIKSNDITPSERRNLESHKKQLVGRTTFICDHCGVKYMDKKEFLLHVEGHISRSRPSTSAMPEDSSPKCIQSRVTGIQSSKQFKCEMCGKEFKFKSCLTRHYVVHSNLKPFKCEACGKMFKAKDALLAHSKYHLDSKLYKCDCCGKGFTRISTLAIHLVIHSGLRPFKCDTCGKGFAQKSNLDTHSVIHSGLRPFKCDTCGKGFASKSNLIAHSVIHSDLRPFRCGTCGRGFNQKCNLDAHSIMHSSFGPFKCETCGKEFKWRSVLRRHSVIHS